MNCWLEDWEIPLLKNRDSLAEVKLLEKYKGLKVYWPDDKKLYHILEQNLEYSGGRDGGWNVLGALPEYFDTEDNKYLVSFQINDVLLECIRNMTQTDNIVVVEPIDTE